MEAQIEGNREADKSTFDLSHNYTLLLNKLEQLAFDLGGDNFTGKKEIEISVSGSGNDPAIQHADIRHSLSDEEYSRFISDIWIGVILTLLIVLIVFFICSCFLYHKFQQWKNSYRASTTEPAEIIRRYDIDVESLPSYTIVSGLPTYDDALEEFRKAGLILTPSTPVIKIFENIEKDSLSSDSNDTASTTTIPATPTPETACTCGGAPTAAQQPPVIELNPEHLHILSQKRLSLQIAFAAPRRNSRPRIDLYREVSRNNMLRAMDAEMFPQIHRSSSALTLSNERSMLEARFASHLQHRGSLT